MIRDFAITKELLYKLYVENNLSGKQIAERLGCSETSVFRLIQKFDIKRIAKVELSRDYLKDLYIDKKLSIKQIANETKYGVRFISKELKKFNIFINKKQIDKELLTKYIQEDRLSYKEIAKLTGWSRSHIFKNAKKLNIRPLCLHENIDKNTLTELYIKQKLSSLEIAKKIGRSKSYVLTHIKRYNIVRRPISIAKRKSTVEDNYFKVWSANMAYILGFIITDGCVYRNTLQFTVHEKDIQVLEFIRDEIAYNKKITSYKCGKQTHNKLEITSEEIIKDLYDLGITERKTGKEILPKCTPKEFLPDLIRGIIDGDGSIIIYEKQNPIITITSINEEFCKQIVDNVGYGYVYTWKKLYGPKATKPLSLYKITKQSDFIRFVDWIYNGNFCLSRKFYKSQEGLEYIQNRKKLL